eukprot:TRINITY_DN78023_c0_g1_i1.p1 TRINITY_DN78023_c0_g1~~TRINITY_DN78023_c0_g1_i1.p1  ORF type:complete len:187 (-),score=41.71 TRINITY_DN78023_c0_g1_i1:147-656(-)
MTAAWQCEDLLQELRQKLDFLSIDGAEAFQQSPLGGVWPEAHLEGQAAWQATPAKIDTSWLESHCLFEEGDSKKAIEDPANDTSAAFSLAASGGAASGESWPPVPSAPELCPSVGSIGHPQSCGLACKYNWKPRGCKDGSMCIRCHKCSWKRTEGEKRSFTKPRRYRNH